MKFINITAIFAAVMLIAVVGSTGVHADRARPHIDNSTGYPRLLSDMNTELRGVSLSWDYGTGAAPVVPTQQQLNNLANNYGLNCVHVYLESYWVTVGSNASIADTLVDRCSNAGLYVIFTIGCADSNGSFKSDEATNFWNFYASRYKDRTHVIYEAYNEPQWYGPDNWSTSDWNNQIAMYKNIRSQAPNTHILLCTFMGGLGSNSTALVNGVNYMKSQGVDFSNASIAFHGYTDSSSLESGITAAEYDSVPLALTCTEWSTSDTSYVGIYENHRTNWMYFTWLTASDSDLSTVTNAISSDGIHWTPDHGTYPGWTGHVVALKSNANSYYVTANLNNSSGSLGAYWASSVGSWEKFYVTDAGSRNAGLLCQANGKYVSCNLNSSNQLMASWATSIGSWETFYIQTLGPSKIALYSPSAGYYVTTNQNNSSNLQSIWATSVGSWEVYYVTDLGTSNASGISNGTYKLTARHSGKAMDAYGAQSSNGTQIIQWTYGGSSNQKWTLTDTGSGKFKIIGVQSGKSLDISNWGTSNGTKVQLWDYAGGTNQLFTFTATDSGYYRITPQCATSSCLDVSGVSTSDGALVQLWAYGGGSNQQWALQSP